jgi:hypothetical protein
MLVHRCQGADASRHAATGNDEQFSIGAAESTQAPIDENDSKSDRIAESDYRASDSMRIRAVKLLAFQWPEVEERIEIGTRDGRNEESQNGYSLAINRVFLGNSTLFLNTYPGIMGYFANAFSQMKNSRIMNNPSVIVVITAADRQGLEISES